MLPLTGGEGRGTEMLADQFAAAQSRTIEWNGLLVHSMYESEGLTEPHTLQIDVLSVVSAPRQALMLEVSGGVLGFPGELLAGGKLWVDTSPKSTRVLVKPKGNRGARLRIWNAWDAGGVTQFWIGNAGILIENAVGGVTLHCSDGNGEVTFDDLVVRITLQPVGDSSAE